MPSVAQFDLPALASGKKRRRDDDGSVYGTLAQKLSLANPDLADSVTAAYYNRDSTQHYEQSTMLSTIQPSQRLVFPPTSLYDMPRKVIPLPSSKRRRAAETEGDETVRHDEDSRSNEQQHFPHAHPEHSTSHTSPHTQDNPTRPSLNTTRTNSSLLSPCHICHRKPTRKSDLDSYAHCMGCGERTCFVCMRECQGWSSPPGTDERAMDTSEGGADGSDNSFTMQDAGDSNPANNDTGHIGGHSHPLKHQYEEEKSKDRDHGWADRTHRPIICSRCCIERGSEGDIVCLGCLGRMEGV